MTITNYSFRSQTGPNPAETVTPSRGLGSPIECRATVAVKSAPLKNEDSMAKCDCPFIGRPITVVRELHFGEYGSCGWNSTSWLGKLVAARL